MSNRWFWIILIIFVAVGTITGFLYWRYTNLLNSQPNLIDTLETDSLLITDSKPNPNQKEYLHSSILNRLTVEKWESEELVIDGEKKLVLNLVVSFKYEGENKTLTIPFIESVLFRKLGPLGLEDIGITSVDTIRIEKGSIIDVSLSYIPLEDPVSKDELINYCNERNNEICLNYLGLGFGDEPIDFNAYLQEILTGIENQVIDYKVFIPSSLFLIEN